MIMRTEKQFNISNKYVDRGWLIGAYLIYIKLFKKQIIIIMNDEDEQQKVFSTLKTGSIKFVQLYTIYLLSVV